MSVAWNAVEEAWIALCCLTGSQASTFDRLSRPLWPRERDSRRGDGALRRRPAGLQIHPQLRSAGAVSDLLILRTHLYFEFLVPFFVRGGWVGVRGWAEGRGLLKALTSAGFSGGSSRTALRRCWWSAPPLSTGWRWRRRPTSCVPTCRPWPGTPAPSPSKPSVSLGSPVVVF